MMNKLTSIFLLLFLATACKTSGDLRAEKMSQDPSEIKTITTANQRPLRVAHSSKKQEPQEIQTVAAQPQQNVNEDLAREVEILKGQLQEKDYVHNQEKTQQEAKLQALEQDKTRLMEEIQILKGTAPAAAAQGGNLLWETAIKDIQNKKYDSAVSGFKEFLENFPNDARAEEALILKGQTEYAAEQFKPALVTFGNYLDKYPKGKSRPMAWLGQGTALLRLKQKKDAQLFLEQCVSLHPKSKEAKLAKRLLKTPNNVPPTIFI